MISDDYRARVLDDESVPKADYAKVVEEREHYRELYLQALEQCRKLELGILGQKSERLGQNEAQLTMAVLATLLGRDTAAPKPDDKQPVRKHERQKPTGRKPLPESLPRVEIELVPDDVQREGLDAFERIGEDVSETVERRPGSLVVVRIRRPKFVRKDRERCGETTVEVAPVPELPITRALCGPGLLANTIVRRWQDHLPLNRLEQVYAREGLELARSTMCGWHAEAAALARPVVRAMWLDALRSPYLCTDATGVLVQAQEKCRHSHFWVVVAPERHVLFAYSPKHDSAAVDQILAGYSGYLVADAHSVYDHLYRSGQVIEVACWAHLRRYFFKTLESEPERARQALGLIGELFRIERSIAEAPPGKRGSVRAQQSRPIVERFFDWCDAEVDKVLDETPIAKAMTYARNQQEALKRFLDDARLPLCNNISERALRREVLGRRNWTFIGNDDAGEVNTVFVSLLARCQLHGIEPWSYLRDLFCVLPSWPQRRVLDLAPACWLATMQEAQTQRLLSDNAFRRATFVAAAEATTIERRL
jgi:transposase